MMPGASSSERDHCGDRLDWIFAAGPADLVERYDRWAKTYDADHDDWGWRGPEQVAESVMRLASRADAVVLDAGCGTGRAGVALRRAGWTGRLIGLDLSAGMLAVADEHGVYDELVRASVVDTGLRAGAVDAVVSSGVFTHGHVGGEGLAELCRVTAEGGPVALTQRVDLLDAFASHDAALIEAGRWELAERSEPVNLHPDRGDTLQVISTWRVLRSV